MIQISNASKRLKEKMYLLDTNVISECRKGTNADKDVQRFFKQVLKNEENVYLSVITIGELRRGIELIRHRNDLKQAELLEKWFQVISQEYSDYILPFDYDCAQVWGKLRVPHYENSLDKQIAATALIYNLTIVTRNSIDFKSCGVKLVNPFESN